MTKLITPCLWFDGRAQEAAETYCSVFKNTRITAQSPIVTEIEVSSQRIVLLNGGPIYKPNPSISLRYACTDKKEFDAVWSAFADGGTILSALNDHSNFRSADGWITDNFGISWKLTLDDSSGTPQKVAPWLTFAGSQYGRAEEAIEHYSSIFSNVSVDILDRYGANESPNAEGKIRRSQVDFGGQKIILSDNAEDDSLKFTEGVSLTVYCETQDEIDHYWTKLTECGTESMCGWLKDKFGVSWQILPSILGSIMGDPAKAGRAAQVFMSMRKCNIEQIVQASLSREND